MGHRMRVVWTLIYFMVSVTPTHTFIPGADGPVIAQEALEGGSTSLYCDASADPNDELMLLVWYKNNAPIYSFDARDNKEWINPFYNATNRLRMDLQVLPTALNVLDVKSDDQAFYHCRVDFFLAPTRNIGVNLTVIVLPSQPFFMDELGNKVEEKIGPYHEGDTLVLSCLVIGGRPPPKIHWYSGEDLIDASDNDSDIPGVKENELYLPLTRSNAEALSCRATNTHLAKPVITDLEIDLYLPAYNVSINWVQGPVEGLLQSGRPEVVKCVARGSYPAPELSWWLDHKHLTHHSNQSWDNATRTASSHLQLTPAVGDHGATLACVATNTAMPPGRDSKADLVILNVTYSPIVEITKQGDGRLEEVVELERLQLDCEVKANPPVFKYKWFYNDLEIGANSLWGSSTSSATLVVEETTRELAGRYCCSALNGVGETRSDTLNITVLYPPECSDEGITLVEEQLECIVRSLPEAETYFWHVQPPGEEVQQLTTESAILPLAEISGSLATTLTASCEATNGVSSQYRPCHKVFHFESLRPPPPQQCDLSYDDQDEEFQMRCVPVENATYYEVSVWRLSTSNSSLMLERKGSMGYGTGRALALGGGGPWLVRGTLGELRPGDEAGAAACNRFGCSAALLLRPTEKLLSAAEGTWWKYITETDVGISIGAVVLVAVFTVSSAIAVRLARRKRRKPAPVIQVVPLEDIPRDYLDALGDKTQMPCSLRSCSSGYSEGSLDSAPPVDRRKKPRVWDFGHLRPPPDVTLTPHRESAV
ncbi:hemicentin-2-like isoform X2 [Aricia agestis]|uniref:hemicentin-2-like isoform X2 n=1 Tax=Aricia agestis TaxID=91739 RepID=UPI001C207F61|nr:hemicentin-2-like isoform X2 [Aricia agestis]